ncbi:hypothetical protein [Micromonospora rhizosphaerae]|uniref:hypothetical protein n=1 Tax=Micromonospora rhizosphaerae TaxID=568872 RepID=UPI00114D3988|nr:hypothetical protein [Micromonospora rhizosphaerae]
MPAAVLIERLFDERAGGGGTWPLVERVVGSHGSAGHLVGLRRSALAVFRTHQDGVVFGLIDESGGRAGDGSRVDWVELYPDRLGFHEPWDGLYDT